MGIKSTGRFIKNQNLWVLEDRARDSDTLFLTAGKLQPALTDHGIVPIRQIVDKIMDMSQTRGFLYYVSLTGVTAARSQLATGIEEGVRAAKAHGDIPVCVGFGIKTPARAAEIGQVADGVVVGSAIVERIAAGDAPAQVLAFVKSLADAAHAARG